MAIIKRTYQPRGFTIFFAVLVAGLALSVGLVIYDLLIRQLALSQVATQSQYAIYAADTGAECALYWDLKYGNTTPTDADGSAFATSSDWNRGGTAASVAGVNCNGQSIWDVGTIVNNNTGNTGWVVSAPNGTNATTTFWVSAGATLASPCVKVEVGKSGIVSQTTIISHGYNTCASGTLRLERTLQVNY